MHSLIRYALLGVLIESVSLLAYIGVAHSAFADPGKHIVLGICYISIIGLFVAAVRMLSLKELILLIFIVSAGLMAAYEIVGFAFFPGLVRGTPLFSARHFQKMARAFITLLCGHLGLVVLLLVVKQLLKWTPLSTRLGALRGKLLGLAEPKRDSPYATNVFQSIYVYTC